MQNKYQIRVNGRIIPHIRVQNELIDGVPCGKQQIAIEDPQLGWFTIDDNENLVLSGVPEFLVEMRDSTIPPIDRRALPNKGWERVCVTEILVRLEATGVLR